MSDGLIIALVTGGFTVLNTAINLLTKNDVVKFGKRTVSKVEEVDHKIDGVGNKVDEVHTNTNHKMDDLLRVSKQASHAEGKLEGIQEQKEEENKK